MYDNWKTMSPEDEEESKPTEEDWQEWENEQIAKAEREHDDTQTSS